MRLAQWAACVFIWVSGAVSVSSAIAQTCYPLGPGYRWKYHSLNGEHETHTVIGTTTMWGNVVSVVEYSESTWNDGLINWISTDLSGAGLLWGAWRPQHGVRYYPPIRFVPGDPVLGEEWSVTTLVRFLPDTTNSLTITLSFRVDTDETLALPVGQVHAFGIGSGRSAEWPLDSDFLGRRGTSRDDAVDWFSPGIGEVQYSTSSIYQLTEYDFPSVPVGNVTWGGLKFKWLPESMTGKTAVPSSQTPRRAPGPVEPIRLPR